MTFQGLKVRIFNPIEKYSPKWLQELPQVIWGLSTQKSQATGYSPFFLVYGSEAVLPRDIGFGATRIQKYEEGEAEMTRHQDIDSVEEHRVTTALEHAQYEKQL
jgi:hypothetical protein